MKNYTEVIVAKLPNCDFCKEDSKIDPSKRIMKAQYDGATETGHWAYMCKRHFIMYGIGLGLGRGQKLVLKK